MYTGSIDAALKLPHGQGTMVYVDGSEYNGKWFRGDWSGFGNHICAKTQTSYQGNFLDNIRNGLFVVSFADGRVYDGIYQMGVMGKGVMKLSSPHNGAYWGYFDDDGCPHGRGKVTMHDGREYDGEWVHGVMEGHGRITYSEEQCTEAEMDNSERSFDHGDDDNTNNRSKFYLGTFSRGKRCGPGILVAKDESILYDGLWYNDKPIEASCRGVAFSRSFDSYDHEYQSNGTCKRLLGSIPKILSPCSRTTKKRLMTQNKRRESFSSSFVQRKQ